MHTREEECYTLKNDAFHAFSDKYVQVRVIGMRVQIVCCRIRAPSRLRINVPVQRR